MTEDEKLNQRIANLREALQQASNNCSWCRKSVEQALRYDNEDALR